MHWTGTIWDTGVKFDSSHDRNQVFVFSLGAGQVISGWDQGILGMRVGGTRHLTLPPDLAYGWIGAPPPMRVQWKSTGPQWRRGESNPYLSLAKASCSRYHYAPGRPLA